MLSAPLTKCLLGLCLVFFANASLANLLINPTRVQFNPEDRSADITLINNSETTNTYRLEWAEKRAKNEGGYEDLSAEEAAGFPTASQMLRFSPRQVTLKPGERQTIKMALRRPQGLKEGDYRSHLLFKALAPEAKAESDSNNPSMAINIVLSFAIPVVVRQGALQQQITVNNAVIDYQPSQKTGSVTLDLSRSGLHSVMGNLKAYWTPNGGQEVLIAMNGDYNFWAETTQTKPQLQWVGADFAVADGKLRIAYEGTKHFRGQVFFDKTFNISRSMIKTH